jgi:hypothetical protein
MMPSACAVCPDMHSMIWPKDQCHWVDLIRNHHPLDHRQCTHQEFKSGWSWKYSSISIRKTSLWLVCRNTVCVSKVAVRFSSADNLYLLMTTTYIDKHSTSWSDRRNGWNLRVDSVHLPSWLSWCRAELRRCVLALLGPSFCPAKEVKRWDTPVQGGSLSRGMFKNLHCC